jgi:hypothetical protein
MIDQENLRLARRALNLYRDGLHQQAFDTVAEIGLTWPEHGISLAMAAWIDMAGARLGVPYGSPTELHYGCDIAHRHTIPESAREWVLAGRLIAARFAWDRETYEALMRAVPHDPVIQARCAAAVLHASATAKYNPVGLAGDPDDEGRRANAALN